MFSIAQSPTYTAPVEGSLPGEVVCLFEAEFARLSQDDTTALVERISTGEATNAQVIVRVLVGWSGVSDEAGEPMPFSASNLSRLLAVYGVPEAIVVSWMRALRGSRAKN